MTDQFSAYGPKAFHCRFQQTNPQDLISEATAIIADMHHSGVWSGEQNGQPVWNVGRAMSRANLPGSFRVEHRATQRFKGFSSVVVLTLFSITEGASSHSAAPAPRRMPVRGVMPVAGAQTPAPTRRRGRGQSPRDASRCILVVRYSNSDGWTMGMDTYVTWTQNALVSRLPQVFPHHDGWLSGTGGYS